MVRGKPLFDYILKNINLLSIKLHRDFKYKDKILHSIKNTILNIKNTYKLKIR